MNDICTEQLIKRKKSKGQWFLEGMVLAATLLSVYGVVHCLFFIVLTVILLVMDIYLYLEFDAEYEYSDYSSASLSYDDVYDEWSWGGNQTKDRELNREASKYLKGVSTVRMGAEAKLDYGLSLRLGYNYVSTPIKSNALQNQFINSASIDYNTSTNYVNLGDINRYTVGLGYKAKHFYTDFAWQYQQQSGDFYAFTTQRGNPSETNEAPCTK